MRRILVLFAAAIVLFCCPGWAQQASLAGPYKLLKTVKVGGDGGFDYVYADAPDRRLYVPRLGPTGGMTVFDLDTFQPVGEIAGVSGHGAVVDAKSHHGFGSSNPIAMWDAASLAKLKAINVDGGPDGIMEDSFNDRVYVFSHRTPNATVIDAKSGSVIGTVDLGGAPEEAVSDGKGHLYIDLEDKGSIAVLDAKTLKATTTYDLEGKGATCAGLAMDIQHRILFAACRNPQTMVILNADNGKILETLPIGSGTDGAVFNPKTMEAFSSQGDGTITVVKENIPTSFVVEQNVQTPPYAKTLTLDTKTNRIILITAEFKPAPAAPPGGRPARGEMIPGTFSIVVVGK